MIQPYDWKNILLSFSGSKIIISIIINYKAKGEACIEVITKYISEGHLSLTNYFHMAISVCSSMEHLLTVVLFFNFHLLHKSFSVKIYLSCCYKGAYCIKLLPEKTNGKI